MEELGRRSEREAWETNLGSPLTIASPLPFTSPFFSLCFSIFPSPDQPANVPVLPPALNTGGSLPDLTNLHFPPPLPTPLDPEETTYPSLSGGNSTSNLTHTMTHLGISGGLGLGPGYEAPGELAVLTHVLTRCCLAEGNGELGGWSLELGSSCDYPVSPARQHLLTAVFSH